MKEELRVLWTCIVVDLICSGGSQGPSQDVIAEIWRMSGARKFRAENLKRMSLQITVGIQDNENRETEILNSVV